MTLQKTRIKRFCAIEIGGRWNKLDSAGFGAFSENRDRQDSRSAPRRSRRVGLGWGDRRPPAEFLLELTTAISEGVERGLGCRRRLKEKIVFKEKASLTDPLQEYLRCGCDDLLGRQRRDLFEHLAKGDRPVRETPVWHGEQICREESTKLHLRPRVGGKDSPAVFNGGLAKTRACRGQQSRDAGKPQDQHTAGDQHLQECDPPHGASCSLRVYPRHGSAPDCRSGSSLGSGIAEGLGGGAGLGHVRRNRDAAGLRLDDNPE